MKKENTLGYRQKKYKVISLSLGGRRNRIFNVGDFVFDSDFYPGVAERYVVVGHLLFVPQSPTICVMISTFNRIKCIEKLTERLKFLNNNYKIIVMDDGTNGVISQDYIDVYLRNEVNGGKMMWWNTVNTLWSEALKLRCDLYIMMPDDALPNDDFFTEAVRIFEEINDFNKIALHLANNGRETNWTKFIRKDFNTDVFLTQTTEFSFICYPEFIAYKIPEVNPVRWKKHPLLGSGVGDRLNCYWIKQNKKIFGVKKSLIHQNNAANVSVMNKKERKLNPWKLL